MGIEQVHLTANDKDWYESANCASVGTEPFFPEKDGYWKDYTDARKVCGACAVRLSCLFAALEEESSGYRYGMRGGHTPRERDAIVDAWKAEGEYA